MVQTPGQHPRRPVRLADCAAGAAKSSSGKRPRRYASLRVPGKGYDREPVRRGADGDVPAAGREEITRPARGDNPEGRRIRGDRYTPKSPHSKATKPKREADFRDFPPDFFVDPGDKGPQLGGKGSRPRGKGGLGTDTPGRVVCGLTGTRFASAGF